MANVTKKLPQKRNPLDTLKLLRAMLPELDAASLAAFGFILLLTVLVALFSIAPNGARNAERLGQWRPFFSNTDALNALEVDFDSETGRVRLREKPGELDALLDDPSSRAYVRAHLNRFNRQVKGRRYHPGMVPEDCIFSVTFQGGEGGKKVAVLEVNDLSAHNRYPRTGLRYANLGPIYANPRAKPAPFLSDGYMGLMLQPGSDATASLELASSGIFTAGSLTLSDTHGMGRATLWPKEDGSAVFVRAEGGNTIFIDNNAPEIGEDRELRNGQIVEIAGRFFETRIEAGNVLATAAQRGLGSKRLYPMGPHFHIVGPFATTGAHQSLGIEYMFREYLEGIPEEAVPPGELWLTLDPALTSELTQSVRRLALQSTTRTASGLMMNAKTGAVLAMAASPAGYDPGKREDILKLFDTNADRRANHGCFKRHVIGSVTKPLFAFLALYLMPETAAMQIETGNRANTMALFGHDLYSEGHPPFKITRNKVDFATYLIHSDNTFQHSLGMLMLAGVTHLSEIPEPWRKAGPRGETLLNPIQNAQFLQVGSLGQGRKNRLSIRRDNPFAVALREVFDVETTPGGKLADDRDISIYGRLLETQAELLRRRYPSLDDPEAVILRRSAVCAPESPRMELEAVRNTKDASNILFGANRNMWTDIKLCESFSRMVTGRKVKARLVYQYRNTLGEKPPLQEIGSEDKVANADLGVPELIVLEEEAPPLTLPGDGGDFPFRELRKHLAQVPIQGTAELLKPAIQSIRAKPGFGRFTLFGKTGTIDDGKPDSKLFMGVFGFWDAGIQEFEGTAISFVFYLKNAEDPDAILKIIAESLPRWLPLLADRSGST